MRHDPFVFHNGRRAHTAEDLLQIIEEGPAELLDEHLTHSRNDFATWAEHALHEPSLAHALRAAKDKDSTMHALKKWLRPHLARETREDLHRKYD